MAMPQLSYPLDMAPSFEGAPADGSQDSFGISATNAAVASFFGRACLLVDTDEEQFTQPTGTTGEFLGVLQHSHAVEQSQVVAGAAGLPVNHPGRVMRRGRIWVVAETTIDDLSAPVYFRHTTAGADPEALGRFRDDDDGASGDVTLITSGVKWRKVTTAIGQLTVLELSLP